MANTTLDEAVANAVNTNGVVEPPTTVEPTTAAAATAPETRTAPAPDQRTQNALLLLTALENPTTGADTIIDLAKRFGLEITQKTTPKAVTKTLIDELKEGIPPEQHFLIDSLGPAIQKIVSKQLEEAVKPVTQQNNEILLAQAKNEVDAAFNRMEKVFPDFRKFEKEMDTLADKFPRGQQTDFDEWLTGLYKLATANKKEAKSVAAVVGRINKNDREAKPASTQVEDSVVKRGSKLPTLNEAIAAAKRGERLE